MKKNFKNSIFMFIGLFLCLTGFIGCNADITFSPSNDNEQSVESNSSNSSVASSKNSTTLDNIPEYSGDAYVTIMIYYSNSTF